MGLAFRRSRAAASSEGRAASVGEAQQYAPLWNSLHAERTAFESLNGKAMGRKPLCCRLPDAR
jgi:hypothetical protein